MKIDFNQSLLGYDGSPIKDGETLFTLKQAALTALKTVAPGDDSLAPLAKFELGSIGQTVAKDLDLTVEQIASLKERIGKVFLSPEMVFAAWNALEGTVTNG